MTRATAGPPGAVARAPLGRALRALRRHGVRRFGSMVLDRSKPVPRWAAEWVWYERDLAASPGAGAELAPGLELRRGRSEDLAILDQLPPDPWVSYMTRGIAAQRLAEGATLWLASVGGAPAMTCWTFLTHGPLYGAREGRIWLPPDVVFVEDVLTWPRFRGRGVASSVLGVLAAEHAAAGRRTMVTRVHVPNAPSRRLFERLGFREVARMQIVERDWRTRIRVAFPGGAAERPWLTALTRG